MEPTNTVLVVGAGPAGLVAAGVLAQQGVRVRLVDRDAGPVTQSRAAVVHVRTLELLDRMGVAGRAVAQGVRTTSVEVLEHGRLLGEIPLAGCGTEALTPYPFALGLGQDRLERLLIGRLGELGVPVEWNTELVALADGRDQVTAVLRRDGGEEPVTAAWVIGADGARSAVRHALGVAFAGRTYQQTGLLADVALDAGAGPDGTLRLHLTRGGFVGLFGLGGDRYRVFGAVPPGLAPAGGGSGVSHEPYAQVGAADLARWFAEYFGAAATIRGVEWTALFRVHSRLADRFQVGRTFLVGDAAHIHSPAGGQGMNLAVGDAFNLGWKLALVVRGGAHPGLLDSYEIERRSVAKTVMRWTDRGFALETAAHPAAVWLRAQLAARLMPVLLRLDGVQTAVFRLFSQTWIGYRGSAAVGGTGGRRLQPGDRAPYGGPQLGPCHQVLLFGEPGWAGAVEAVVRRYRTELPVRLVPASDRVEHRRYGARPPWLVLVRPDGHVGYAGTDLSDFGAYLDRLYIGR